jgi:hypothetical protein
MEDQEMDLKWLAEQVALGRKDVEIAAECGEPVYTVAYYRRTGLEIVRQPEGRRKWDIDEAVLAAEVKAGKSDRQIADEFGMTTSGVRQYRKRYGIERAKGRGNYWAGRTGEQAAHWRGGRMKVGASGYVRLHKPDHPHANKAGYVYEHRYVMEQKIGRLLKREEIVDHIDRNRSNNAPENLRLHESRGQHVKDHFSARDQLVALVSKIRGLTKYRWDGEPDSDGSVVSVDQLNAVLNEAMDTYEK